MSQTATATPATLSREERDIDRTPRSMGGLTDARTPVGTGSRYNMQNTQGDSQTTNRIGMTSREGGHGREESGEEEDIATLEELEELDTMLTAPWQGPG